MSEFNAGFADEFPGSMDQITEDAPFFAGHDNFDPFTSSSDTLQEQPFLQYEAPVQIAAQEQPRLPYQFPLSNNAQQQSHLTIQGPVKNDSPYMSIGQQPYKCRSNAMKKGVKGAKGSYFVEPTPILEMHFQQDRAWCSANPHIFAITELQSFVDGAWICVGGLSGMVNASVNSYRETKGVSRAVFQFPYLEVGPEGFHRFLFRAYQECSPSDGGGLMIIQIATIISNEFEVLKPTAAFTFPLANPLAIRLNENGLKTRPRKSPPARKRSKADVWSVDPHNSQVHNPQYPVSIPAAWPAMPVQARAFDLPLNQLQFNGAALNRQYYNASNGYQDPYNPYGLASTPCGPARASLPSTALVKLKERSKEPVDLAEGW